jgi:hypothetical protein
MLFLVGINSFYLIRTSDFDLGAMAAHVLGVLAVLAQTIRECRSHATLGQ